MRSVLRYNRISPRDISQLFAHSLAQCLGARRLPPDKGVSLRGCQTIRNARHLL